MFGFLKSQPITTLAPDEAHRLARSGAVHLVDVREPSEWASARIPGALHRPLSTLHDHAAALPTDKPVVFYCLSGARSGQAIALCRRLGFPHDRHVGGGIRAWAAAGLPTER